MQTPDRVQRRELAVLAVALVLAMSTWFSTAAVLGPVQDAWSLSMAEASWLTIAVQLGFVAGALILSVANLADRVAPRRLILFGAIGAATANALIVTVDGLGPALGLRLVTGAFLAAVYPPSLKAMSHWFVHGRGLALGVMLGALTVGSALPHLVNSVGGLRWEATMLIASAATLLGGVVAEQLCADGPHAGPAAAFDPGQLRAIVATRGFRLASVGYFGHMWELYAMWAWIAVFFGEVFESTQKGSLAAFVVIASGAGGSIYVGVVSDRLGRSRAAGRAMRWSAAIAAFIGFFVDAPWPIVLGLGMIWGFWVVADSAQFSAIVTEVVDARYVGTALTVQLAAGFVLTVFTIFLVPVIRDAHGWGWAFMLLAPGPLLGAWAMRTLRAELDI